MSDVSGYIVVVLLLMGFMYALAREAKHAIYLQKNSNHMKRVEKKELVNQNLLCLFLGGFITSYLLNILVGLHIIASDTITSNTTGVSCVLFLLAFIVVKIRISRNKQYEGKLLGR
jgi:hypothetical protein